MLYQLVVSFLAGVIFEKYFYFGWSFALLIFLISLISFFYLRFGNQKQYFPQGAPLKNFAPKGAPLRLFLIFVFFTFGILRIDLVNNLPDQNLLKIIGQKISFEAIIVEEPDVRDTSARYIVETNKNFDSQILLITDRFPEYKYGDKIKVSGKLELPKNFSNSNGMEFNYVSYLAKDKIYFLAYRPQIEKLEGFGGNIFLKKLYDLKNIFIEKISDVIPEPNSSLVAGMIFGAKQSLGQNLLNDFKKVGLIHIVVLSGYNITIIAVGIFWAMSFFGKRNLSFVLSAVLILFFALMVGFSATVVRAVIMALISILALYLGRPSDALRWLFIAAFLMIIWNPLILFYDPSFQLSFTATLGLILFSEIIDKKFISQIIRLALKMGAPVSCIVFFEKIKMREIISSTLAVQFFILPMLIKISGFISTVSFLINPIVLPFTPYVMGFGALTGTFGLLPFVGKFLSWPFGIISYILTQIIISLTEFSASFSLATFQIGTISFWFIFVWYAGCGILYWKLTSPLRPWRMPLS